jgi:hypothetical protein
MENAGGNEMRIRFAFAAMVPPLLFLLLLAATYG